MPRYTIKKGYENRVFHEQGIVRVSETEVESDHELNSPILTLVQDAPAANQPAAQPSQPVQPAVAAPAPAQPAAPQAPVAENQTANKGSEG